MGTKMIKILIAITLSLLCFSAVSYEMPYLGADINTCKTCCKKEYGAQIIKNKSIGGSFFLGIPLSQNSAIEVGYHRIDSSQYSTAKSGNIINGALIPPIINYILYKSSLSIKGPFAGFLFFSEKQKFNGLQPFFGFGLMDVNTRIKRQTVYVDNLAGLITREMTQQRWVPRFTAGFNYFISENSAIRTSLVYLNTNRLRPSSKDDLRLIRTHLKNSLCFGLGLTSKIN